MTAPDPETWPPVKGQEVIWVSGRHPKTDQRTLEVVRVGRKYAYVTPYGSREVAFDLVTGRQNVESFYADEITTEGRQRAKARRRVLESRIIDLFGARPPASNLKAWSDDQLERLIAILEES